MSDIVNYLPFDTYYLPPHIQLANIYPTNISTFDTPILPSAEAAVRDMLRTFSLQEGMKEEDTVTAEDHLDDGTPIVLNITINRKAGTALFDFTGTGPEIYGNLNAPPAVTASAVIYCLRCLLPTSDIPLNQGVLTPVEIRIPPQSVLNPSAGAAVVGGNVQTSQRVTDVVLDHVYTILSPNMPFLCISFAIL